MVTALPVFSTTIVFGLAAATAPISSFWVPGRSMSALTVWASPSQRRQR